MGPKGSSAISTSLKKSIMDKNAAQLKAIQVACDRDFELQTLVLATIENHKNAKLSSSANNLLDAMAKEACEKAARKQAECGERDLDATPTGVLRRGQLYFKRWGPELILSAMQYCDAELRGLTLKETVCVKQRGRELLEFAFDVKTGSAPDRVATDDVSVLWPRMKKVYEENGRRLRGILSHIVANSVVWPEHGFFQVSVASDEPDAEVTVSNRITGMSTVVPANIVGMDAQNILKAKVGLNFSQAEGHVTTDADTYNLAVFFPSARRSLKRRLSQEEPIIASQSVLEAAKKAAKCKTEANVVRGRGSGGGAGVDAAEELAPGGTVGASSVVAGGAGAAAGGKTIRPVQKDLGAPPLV